MPSFVVKPVENESVALVTEAGENVLYVRFSARVGDEIVTSPGLAQEVAKEIQRERQMGKTLHRGIVVGTDALLSEAGEGRAKALTLLRDLFAAFQDEQLPLIWRTRGGISGPLGSELLEAIEAAGDWLSLEIGIPTLDEKLVKALEGPHTPTVRERLKFAGAMHARDIPVRALIDPLVPMLTDAPAELEALLAALHDVGVYRISVRYLVLTRDRAKTLAAGLSKMHRALIRGCFKNEKWRKPNAKAAGVAAYHSHKLLPAELRRRGHDRITSAAAVLGITVITLDPAEARVVLNKSQRPQLDLF